MKTLRHPAVAIAFVFFFPLLVQVFFAEYVSRELHTRLGWCVLLWSFSYIFRSKILVVAVASFFLLAGGIDIAYAVVFNGVFTTSSVEAMAQSNSSEALEFFVAYFSVVAFIIIIFYFAAASYLLKTMSCPGLSAQRRWQICAISFFVLLSLVIFKGAVIDKKYGKLIPGVVGAYPEYLKGSLSLNAEIASRVELVAQEHKLFQSRRDDEQVYVFVIGESATRAHMQLYGYPRTTTPYLSARNDLLVFDNMISNFVQTLPSLRAALTEASTEKSLAYYEALSLVDVANKAGFETHWLSNQQPLRGTYSAIAAMADQREFVSNDFHGSEVARFDGYLLPKLAASLASKAKKKAIFIHLMGSHLKYDKRYPEDFSKFSAPPYFAFSEDLNAEQRHYIDSYDNSILYKDWLLNAMLEQLQQHAQNREIVAALSYTSDHGEEVYDRVNFKGHGPDNLSKNMFDVPFLLWLSPAYTQALPETLAQAKANASSPAMLDHYFDFALDLMQIASPEQQPEKSLLSPYYQEPSRLVYGRDYEQAFNQPVDK